jgi:PAS domain S-box-containing protein
VQDKFLLIKILIYKRDNLKYICLLFFIINISLYANNPTSNLEKIKLQLQWEHQFEFAGFYAAKEKGFYKDVGLDVDFVEFDPKTNIVDEVLNGNADYGLTYSSLIVDYMQGKPLVFVANFFKQSPLVLVTQKDIYTPDDLKGKKIIGLLDSSHKQTVLTMLDKFNVKPKDFQNIPQKFSLENFIDKKVDAISVFTTNEIFTLNKLGIQYNILDPAAFGTKFYDLNLFTTKSELINNPTRVENFKKASIKGWEYALSHKDELVQIISQKYNTQNKSKEALLFESKQIEYLMLTNIYPIGSIDFDMVEKIADNFAQSLLLEKISKEKIESFIYKSDINYLELNDKQKEYLKNKKELKICVDPNWLPLEKIENGKHIGISAEFIELISQKLKIPIKLIETTKWAESIEKIKLRKCDILSLAEKTPLRSKYLDFTSAYINIPLVLATKTGLPFIDKLTDLKGKNIGVVKKYSIEELLISKYPDINIIEVESTQEGLALVQQEKVFGFLDNSMVINNEIQKSKMIGISITGQFAEAFNLGIASRNDEHVLNEILQKALLSIDDKHRTEFIQKWNNINYQVQTNNQLFIQTLFFAVVFISIFIYWNLKLKEEIKNKELVQRKLKESEERFRTLFDIAPVLLDAFDKNGKVVLWNKECEKVFGWSFDEITKVEKPLELFYPDPMIQKEILNAFNDNSHNIYKEWHPMTKYGNSIITKWANIKLLNNEVIHIGYDITQQRNNEVAIHEKAVQLKIAKQQVEEINNSLEKKIKNEIDKNTKQQIILMHQSKLAQMGEMIENIAHQWRQPLAQINSTVLLIDMELNKNKFKNSIIENKLTEIESLTAYMSKTIDDFKNFFNPNKQKSSFLIEDAIQKAKDIVKGSVAFHHIDMNIDIEKNLECYSYPEELQQVILTIFNNAIEALILMNISSPEIFIRAYEKEDNIFINIKDNALGINSDYLDKIFEPYFTTKAKSQGTGLGLYMAKMIIENGLSGYLSVKNKLNGACFTIKIPKGKE